MGTRCDSGTGDRPSTSLSAPRKEAETARTPGSELTDEVIVERVRAGEHELYEILIRRHNQRLYRVARSILRDEAEAEDVMQDAYVRAYTHLEQFEGRASFATWLTKIAVHEALARARRKGHFVEWDETMTDDRKSPTHTVRSQPTPEDELSQQELGHLLTQAIEALPPMHRLVFVMRQVEGMSTDQVAESLGITQENVKVRLHRARATLRDDIDRRVGQYAPELFAFHLSRCDRVTKNVLARLSLWKRPDRSLEPRSDGVDP